MDPEKLMYPILFALAARYLVPLSIIEHDYQKSKDTIHVRTAEEREQKFIFIKDRKFHIFNCPPERFHSTK